MTKERAESKTIHVADFGRKLWLLMLIHEAIHSEGNGEAVGSWFSKTLFEVKPRSFNSRKDVEGSIDAILEEYQDVATNPKAIKPARFPFKHGMLNRRLGADLLVDATAPERAESRTFKAIAALFEKADVLEVERRVVYRCARGYAMVPYGYSGPHESKDPSSQGQLNNAQHTDPSFFRLDETDKGKAHAEQITYESDYIKDRALAVLQAFCGPPKTGRTTGSKTNPVYGESYKVFEKAALAYYCEEDSEPAKQEYPAGLFDTSKKGSRGNVTPAATAVLSEGKHTVSGEGHSFFGATYLEFEATVPDGQLKVIGRLDCSGNEALEFTKLNIKLAKPVGLSGFKAEINRDPLKNGRTYFRQGSPTLVTEAANTAGLVQCWNEPFPLYDFDNSTAPFYLSYTAGAPLATISHKSAGNVGGNQLTTPADVVCTYLRNLTAPGQTDWVPPPIVPVISDGYAAFGDVERLGET